MDPQRRSELTQGKTQRQGNVVTIRLLNQGSGRVDFQYGVDSHNQQQREGARNLLNLG